jgi:Glycosyl transferases group 1
MSSPDKPKLLIVSLNFPYPLNNGGAIAQSFFLEGLKKDFTIYFVTAWDCNTDIVDFKKIHPEINVINLYDFSKSNGLGFLFKLKMAIRNLVKPFENSNSPFYSHEDHLESDYIMDLVNIKSSDFLFFLNDLIKRENINLVQLEFFETLDLVAGLPAGTKIIFVNHELRSKRIRLAAAHSKTTSEYQGYLIKLTELYEYELLKRCDKVIVFNQDDLEILKKNNVNSFLSPYGIPDSLHIRKKPSESFSKMVFVGSESHFPNKEGLSWFLDTIYLDRSDGFQYPIWIIGKWSSEFRSKYKNRANVIFKGVLESIHECYESSIMIAPILSGSGLRTKILDAFVNYVPVFCTPFACEGIDVSIDNGRSLEVFSNKEDFSGLLQNHSDKSLTELALSGNKYYKIHFNHGDLLKARHEVYK